MELDTRGSVLQCVQRATGLQRAGRAEACSAASSSPAGPSTRSRWSRSRAANGGALALALVVASGANFLVVDEPTNHLDLESREALEAALEAFPGTVLLVSHDRALLDAVAERTIAIEDHRLNSYDGGWAEYVRQREARKARAATSTGRAQACKAAQATPRKAKAPSELERIEAQIAERETTVAELERRLGGRLERRRDAGGPPPRTRRAQNLAPALGAALRAARAFGEHRVSRPVTRNEEPPAGSRWTGLGRRSYASVSPAPRLAIGLGVVAAVIALVTDHAGSATIAVAYYIVGDSAVPDRNVPHGRVLAPPRDGDAAPADGGPRRADLHLRSRR